jgi:hypothetical protein
LSDAMDALDRVDAGSDDGATAAKGFDAAGAVGSGTVAMFAATPEGTLVVAAAVIAAGLVLCVASQTASATKPMPASKPSTYFACDRDLGLLASGWMVVSGKG